MSHAPPTSYADRVWFGAVEIVENVPIARDTFRLRFTCPKMAQQITPGQFLMLRLAGSNDPLLGRPMALYDTVLDGAGRASDVVVVYRVMGRMTARLAGVARGQRLDAWGPLGNGFPPQDTPHLVIVAGGIGQTPFVALAQEYRGVRQYGLAPRHAARDGRVTMCYGVRSRVEMAGVDDFERAGVHVHISTDDGTAGHHGLVTELADRVLERIGNGCRVVCCGPEPMMAATARLSAARGIACQVSLETPMACGIGICFSCVAKVRQEDGDWDYRRTCVEGPIFDALSIEF